MKHRSTLLGASVLALLVASASAGHATDLFSNPGSLKDIVSSGANTWTGFYIGGNIGAGWDSNQDITSADIGGNTVSTSGISGLGVSPSGWLGGVQIGYNFLFPLGIQGGIETDLQITNLTDNSTARVNGVTVGQVSGFVDWFGTTRLKAGIPIGKITIYGTAGVAYGGVRTSATSDQFGVNLSNDTTRFGWTAGGGAEMALSKDWSMGVEYLRVDLGSDTLSGVSLGNVPTTTNGVDNAFDVVRVRANYHLN